MSTPYEEAALQQTLREGVNAIRRGDRARGRELLLRVVNQNDQSEEAWLWLSSVMEDAEDRITALENALDLNPNNPEAVKVLEMRREIVGRMDGLL